MGKYGCHVIDGDGYVTEPIEAWGRCLDRHYRDIGPRLVTDNRGQRTLIDGWFNTAPAGPGEERSGGYVGALRADKYKGGSDSDAPPKDMDAERIDIALLFATVTMRPSSGILPSADVGLEVALCRAYNSWVAEYVTENRARLKPVAVLPTRDIPEAVRELTMCVKRLGFVGAELLSNSQGRIYPGDPYFYPLSEEAQRLNMPVFIYPHAGGQINYIGRERFRNCFQGIWWLFPSNKWLLS